MSVNNENNPVLIHMPIGSISAGAATTLPGLSLNKRMRLSSAKIINNAALSGDDTNNVQIELKKGSTQLAVHLNDVASGGLAQRVGKAMTLNSTPANLLLASLSDLDMVISHNGSGAALTNAVLQLELINR